MGRLQNEIVLGDGGFVVGCGYGSRGATVKKVLAFPIQKNIYVLPSKSNFLQLSLMRSDFISWSIRSITGSSLNFKPLSFVAQKLSKCLNKCLQNKIEIFLKDYLAKDVSNEQHASLTSHLVFTS